MFEIDRDYIINQFFEYVYEKNKEGIEVDDKIWHGKKSEYSRKDILEKIKSLYVIVVKLALIPLKRHFIHDDEEYNAAKRKLVNHAINKLKTTTSGVLYINVNGKVVFTGDDGQYEEWIINRKNLIRILRYIVAELNDVISGTIDREEDKSVLYNITEEDAVDYVMNFIPKRCLSDKSKLRDVIYSTASTLQITLPEPIEQVGEPT